MARTSTSRFGRAARLGDLAAGAAGRQVGAKVAGMGRTDQQRAAADRKAAMPTAERMVEVLGSMRGAAMKIGQSLSVVDARFVGEELREEFQAKLAGLQHLKNVGLLLKIAERITEELDLELETDNHRAMARASRGHPFIVVPDVITDLCRERVIVTEWVEARRFAGVRDDPQAARDRFGEVLFRFYVNGPFRHRLLNGDPQPGNALFLDDVRVAFLDFGFFKRQSREGVADQLEVLEAVYAQDADRLHELSRAQGVIAAGPEIKDALLEKYRVATRSFLEDREVAVAPADVTRISRLGACGNWFRIGREVLFDEAPQTELGQAEAAWRGEVVPA